MHQEKFLSKTAVLKLKKVQIYVIIMKQQNHSYDIIQRCFMRKFIILILCLFVLSIMNISVGAFENQYDIVMFVLKLNVSARKKRTEFSVRFFYEAFISVNLNIKYLHAYAFPKVRTRKCADFSILKKYLNCFLNVINVCMH